MADIELPQLGESVTEGTITRWFKQVGDQVAEDEVLFEVSTDKVDSEVPSPVGGYLTEILVDEGDTVDVGTRLAVVSDSPPADGGGDAGASAEEPASEPEPEAAEEEPEAEEPEPEPEAEEPEREEPAAEEPEPEAEEPAAEEPEPEPEPEPEKPAATQEPAPEPQPKEQAPPSGDGEAGGPALSPVVRRLVDESGIDPATIKGTGAGGRVTRSDVEQAITAKGDKAPPSAAPAPAAPAAKAAPAPSPAAPSAPAPRRAPAPTPVSRGTDTAIPFSKMRTITAEHMVRSQATSAHAYVSVEVDYEAVERVRRVQKERFKAEEGTSLTYLPFISRALIDALAEFPNLNASVGDDELVVHGDIHLGIAVDLDYEGLIVPVVHDAQDKRLRAIARDIADVADRAHRKKLTADDITGGTVTITNIGFTGNAFLLPVINQPQIAILSTDGVRRKPVVVDIDGTEGIAIHSVGNLTLGWDHRAVDGAYAAAFLARVREILETRDWDAEL